MEAAENRSMVLESKSSCSKCRCYHLRDAKDEAESDAAAKEYRRILAAKYPALAQARGWDKEA